MKRVSEKKYSSGRSFQSQNKNISNSKQNNNKVFLRMFYIVTLKSLILDGVVRNISKID